MHPIMKRYLFIIAITLLFINNAFSQFAPQHPLVGNDAIHFSDTSIKSWITSATIKRGWQNILDTAIGKASVGDSNSVIGAYNNQVVSLGDGGSIILFFENGIKNGPGADFAIFENGIINILDSSLAFLELAFVEVSSNRKDFVRFPCISNIQDTLQLTNGDYMDASAINNLAGKYRAGYGTPFDLDALKDNLQINLDSIYYIKLIDVIGSIDENIGSRDANGKIINDPFPTPFPSSGFDLNAIGILHPITIDSTPNTISSIEIIALTCYPNPTSDYITINHQQTIYSDIEYCIIDVYGRIIVRKKINGSNRIPVGSLSSGKYTIILSSKNNLIGHGNFIKI